MNGDTYEGNWYEHLRHGQGTYTYASTGTKYIGTWINGKREGSGEMVHSNHRFVGTFAEDFPKGLRKYKFDMGCEQHGEYILEEQIQEGDTEEDEQITITTPKWKCSRITEIENVVYN